MVVTKAREVVQRWRRRRTRHLLGGLLVGGLEALFDEAALLVAQLAHHLPQRGALLQENHPPHGHRSATGRHGPLSALGLLQQLLQGAKQLHTPPPAALPGLAADAACQAPAGRQAPSHRPCLQVHPGSLLRQHGKREAHGGVGKKGGRVGWQPTCW